MNAPNAGLQLAGAESHAPPVLEQELKRLRRKHQGLALAQGSSAAKLDLAE